MNVTTFEFSEKENSSRMQFAKEHCVFESVLHGTDRRVRIFSQDLLYRAKYLYFAISAHTVRQGTMAAFVETLLEIIDDGPADVISWDKDGTAIVVHDADR